MNLFVERRSKQQDSDTADRQTLEVKSEVEICPKSLLRYIDIDVDPCTKYVIKVLASEDYQVQIQH